MLDPARAPVPRHVYNNLLRAAIMEVTPGRATITLAGLRPLLADHFPHDLPGQPALSRILQTMGWRKIETDSGPAFACPKPTAATGTLN